MPTAPRTLTDSFAALIACLALAVTGRNDGQRFSLKLVALIIDRLRGINQRVARLVAKINAGRYVRRTLTAPRRPPALLRPRQTSPLTQNFGWLLKLMPEAAGYRAQLENLFRDPDMAALMAAAPAALGRPLRSLCWMLRLSPPAIIAAPARPRPTGKNPQPAAPEPPPPPRPQRPVPWWWQEPPRRTRWSFGRQRGPPRPA